ncbi:unnamed protein product [Fraxinus pennsylvanica]|uniref:Uncharacterized protein n=1 Tax=Fraxinus pennsylvanica TaxID=56036 RepID=A0AAD1YKH3_9LAMI|nr:unnamed protein product [Fraxinus pennsylvanica]
MVRTNPILPSPLNPRPDLRRVNKLGSPSIAGKLPSKPTNTPKFADKCSRPRCLGCHFSKVKGAQKLRSSLITMQIVDEAGLRISDCSARDVLCWNLQSYLEALELKSREAKCKSHSAQVTS